MCMCVCDKYGESRIGPDRAVPEPHQVASKHMSLPTDKETPKDAKTGKERIGDWDGQVHYYCVQVLMVHIPPLF